MPKVARYRPAHMCPSLCCLPALIEEIDGMKRRPLSAERETIINKYRRIELGLCTKSNREVAPKMVNDYLIQVLWRTRKYRLNADTD